jgi:hypothetical protein
VFSQLFKFCDELEEEQKSIRRKSWPIQKEC